MAQDLKSGAIQSAWNIPSAQFDVLNDDAQTSRPSRRSRSASTSSASTAPTRASSPSRQGHPVLQDPAFRQALQWAIDKDKIVEIGYNGNANAADTIITRDFYAPDADFHWTPDEPYTFDLDKAQAALDAAGYTDNDGNGVREYKGKDIELCACMRAPSRSRARTAASSSPAGSRTSASTIEYEVIDDGALGDKTVRLRGRRLRPRLRPVHLGLGRRRRPELHPVDLPDQPDRELERLQLVERGVRRALPRAADTARHPGAHRHGAADAGDRLRRVAVHPAGLPARPAGRRHRRLDRVGARQPGEGRLVVQHPDGHATSPCTPGRPRSRKRAATAASSSAS